MLSDVSAEWVDAVSVYSDKGTSSYGQHSAALQRRLCSSTGCPPFKTVCLDCSGGPIWSKDPKARSFESDPALLSGCFVSTVESGDSNPW